MTIVKKVFSLKGRLHRVEYLLYGILLPAAMFSLIGAIAKSNILSEKVEMAVVLSATFVLFYIIVATLVKRINDATSNILVAIVVFIVFVALMPVAMLYLLLAPPRQADESDKDNSGEIDLVKIVMMFIVGTVVVGFLASIVIPRIAQLREKPTIEKSLKSSNATQQGSALPQGVN